MTGPQVTLRVGGGKSHQLWQNLYFLYTLVQWKSLNLSFCNWIWTPKLNSFPLTLAYSSPTHPQRLRSPLSFTSISWVLQVSTVLQTTSPRPHSITQCRSRRGGLWNLTPALPRMTELAVWPQSPANGASGSQVQWCTLVRFWHWGAGRRTALHSRPAGPQDEIWLKITKSLKMCKVL